ncbi:ABC transporter permease [[Clostridium] symbiosum]|uniref:ABC transporter permease n=1 Tax=Clostridium symbiosum TaxID=1512 RepID=UPI001570854B|nr:FtsX-like permease family protein [[Clostridium] symbiosum]NSF83291.1 ABC transporter permease [[Clostridium] symbiosum]NSI99971.1 ABC transporter permease [[Clostridium] symbiosum]
MGVCRRAALYLARKKGKAFLLFLIFFLVSALLLICFSVLDGTGQAARDLRSNIGAAFYIRPYAQMTLEDGALSEGTTPVISQQSIDEVIDTAQGQVKAYNTEHYGYAKSEQLHFLPGAGDNEASNMGQVTAVRDSGLTDVFLNEEYTLLAGRHIQPDDENKILISAELAAENSLEVGDVLTLTHAGLDQQDGEYIDTIPEKTAFAEVEIVGIFQCDGAADSADSPTAGKAANHIYSDSHLLVNLQEQQEGIFEGEIAFYIADPLELDTLLERVEAIDSIDWDNHILRENDFQYEQIAGQLQNLQNLAVALIAIASALSIVILMLILMMRIRGRIHEAGIYLSVGKSKAEIIGQFTLEAWVLLLVGFLLAFLLWLLCSDTVNGLLFGALAQGTGTAALQTGGSTSNYLQPDLLHSGILFAGELGAVLLTVLAASGTILRLKPKEILTRMS